MVCPIKRNHAKLSRKIHVEPTRVVLWPQTHMRGVTAQQSCSIRLTVALYERGRWERTHGCAIVERFSVHSGSHGGKSVGNLSGPGGFDCAELGVGANASATHAHSLWVDAMAQLASLSDQRGSRRRPARVVLGNPRRDRDIPRSWTGIPRGDWTAGSRAVAPRPAPPHARHAAAELVPSHAAGWLHAAWFLFAAPHTRPQACGPAMRRGVRRPRHGIRRGGARTTRTSSHVHEQLATARGKL